MKTYLAGILGLALCATAMADDAKKTRVELTEEALDTVRVVFDVEDEPLTKVAGIFGTQAGVTVLVDPVADAGDKRVTMSTSGTVLRNAAALFLRDLGLTQVNYRGFLVWTTVERATVLEQRRGIELPAGATDAEEELFRKVHSLKVALNFTETAAADVVSFVADFNGVTVLLETGKDAKVTFAMNDVTMAETLDILAFLLGGEAVIRQGAIIIRKT